MGARRPHRRLEPRRGGDGAARRRRGGGGRAGVRLGADGPARATARCRSSSSAATVEDASGETNMSAYLAVGVWHHWLVRRDHAFVRRMWPVVRRGLDFAVSLQLPWGGIAWSQEWHDGAPAPVNEEALLAASSSIHHALRAGLAIAELRRRPAAGVGAGGRPARRTPSATTRTGSSTRRTSRWTGTTRCSAACVTGTAARRRLDERWDAFVEDGLGIRCVSRNPWVTGAETSELALALEAIGDRERALPAARRHAAPALRRRVVLDRLRLPRPGALARGADHLHGGRGDPRRRRPLAHDARARASCAPPRSARSSPRSAWSAAAPQPTPSSAPGSPETRRRARIDPTTSTSSKPSSSARR